MKVLLCGASDLEGDIRDLFDEIVGSMRFEPHHYDRLNPGTDNHMGWPANSITAVRNCEIIVFVIKEKNGDITWQHEYYEAIKQGKSIIILVDGNLFDRYFKDYLADRIKDVEHDPAYATFQTLDKLLAHQRTPIGYKGSRGFEKMLKLSLNNEMNKAMSVFIEHNKRHTIVEKIKQEDYKDFLNSRKENAEIEILKEVLLDIFEHKEVRKRILSFFTRLKTLDDDQLSQLIFDGEQGVSRATADKLAELVGPMNDKDKLIGDLVSTLESTNDAGIIRRSIKSIFAIDPKIAVKRLKDLFPAHDIGTPKRILRWLLENQEAWTPYYNSEEFKDDVDELYKLCSSYNKNSDSLEHVSDGVGQVLKKLAKAKNE